MLLGAAKGGTYHCPTGGADRADGRGRIGAGESWSLGRVYAAAVLIGNTVSEAVSCGIMALFARQEPCFRPCADDPPRGYTSRELWEIVLPVTGSWLVAGRFAGRESVLIPACLAAYLGTRAEAVAQYGSLKGMALPLIFFRSRCWRHFPAC